MVHLTIEDSKENSDGFGGGTGLVSICINGCSLGDWHCDNEGNGDGSGFGEREGNGDGSGYCDGDGNDDGTGFGDEAGDCS